MLRATEEPAHLPDVAIQARIAALLKHRPVGLPHEPVRAIGSERLLRPERALGGIPAVAARRDHPASSIQPNGLLLLRNRPLHLKGEDAPLHPHLLTARGDRLGEPVRRRDIRRHRAAPERLRGDQAVDRLPVRGGVVGELLIGPEIHARVAALGRFADLLGIAAPAVHLGDRHLHVPGKVQLPDGRQLLDVAVVMEGEQELHRLVAVFLGQVQPEAQLDRIVHADGDGGAGRFGDEHLLDQPLHELLLLAVCDFGADVLDLVDRLPHDGRAADRRLAELANERGQRREEGLLLLRIGHRLAQHRVRDIRGGVKERHDGVAHAGASQLAQEELHVVLLRRSDREASLRVEQRHSAEAGEALRSLGLEHAAEGGVRPQGAALQHPVGAEVSAHPRDMIGDGDRARRPVRLAGLLAQQRGHDRRLSRRGDEVLLPELQEIHGPGEPVRAGGPRGGGDFQPEFPEAGGRIEAGRAEALGRHRFGRGRVLDQQLVVPEIRIGRRDLAPAHVRVLVSILAVFPVDHDIARRILHERGRQLETDDEALVAAFGETREAFQDRFLRG